MIKCIIGLGNPGPRHTLQRHNIGFRIVDLLASLYEGKWSSKTIMDTTSVTIHEHQLTLIKPLTFMNDSGTVIPFLVKQGIKAEQILVVHDELEKPFGSVSIKKGGSHKGHNGLKSLIAQCGPEFYRLRFGIGRPLNKEQVPNYVLSTFNEPADQVDMYMKEATTLIIHFLKEHC